MAIGDDFSIDANGDIRYTGTTANYTVLELHRWLQDKADDAVAVTDDWLDITDSTPSERSTDNIITLNAPYNIDDTAAQHLYDGSITQAGGDTIYSGLVVVGSVEAGTNVIIVQDNALLTDTWSTAPNADAGANIILRLLVKTRHEGANIDGQRLLIQAREYGDTYAEFSVTCGLGNNTAALFTANDLNNETDQSTVNAYDKIQNVEGYQELEISGTAPAEPYYSQWTYTGAGTLPATPVKNDIYEFAKDIQRRGTAETIHGISGALFRGITHSWLYDGITGAEPATNDVIAWGAFLDHGAVTGGPFVVGEVVTGGTSLAVGRVLSVDGTNTSLVVSTQSGTWQSGEVLTGTTSGATATTSAGPVGQATGGGTGLILAIDSAGADDMWIQLTRGTAPADNALTYLDSDHTRSTTVAGTPSSHAVSTPFIGSSTGSAILGAFGIGVDPDDTTNSDLYIDLDGNAVTPPANVTFTVSGLESGQDRVLVGPSTGSTALDDDQLTGATGSNASGAGTWVVNESIPADTPSSGVVRVFNGNTFDRVPYTSWATSTFTLTGTLPNAGASHTLNYDNEASGPFTVGETLTFGGAGTAELLALDDNGLTGSMVIRMISGSTPADNESISGGTSSATADVDGAPAAVGGFIAYIDELATASTATFTTVYDADRTLFVRVRDGAASPIKTFETEATLNNGGGGTTAIRTSDA